MAQFLSYNTQTQRKGRSLAKRPVTLLVGIALVILIGLLLGTYFLNTPTKQADNFVDKGLSNHASQAYSLTDKAYQKKVSKDSNTAVFTPLIGKTYGIKWDGTKQSLQTSSAVGRFKVIMPTGQTVYYKTTVTLVRSGLTWKVHSFAYDYNSPTDLAAAKAAYQDSLKAAGISVQ